MIWTHWRIMQGYKSKLYYTVALCKLLPVLHDWHMHFIACQTPLTFGCIIVMATTWRGKKRFCRLERSTVNAMGPSLHIPNVQILEQYWFVVFIATIIAESWHIPDRHPHSNIISSAVKKQTPTKLHYWIYKKVFTKYKRNALIE